MADAISGESQEERLTRTLTLLHPSRRGGRILHRANRGSDGTACGEYIRIVRQPIPNRADIQSLLDRLDSETEYHGAVWSHMVAGLSMLERATRPTLSPSAPGAARKGSESPAATRDAAAEPATSPTA